MNIRQFQQIQLLNTGSTTYINDVFNIMNLNIEGKTIPEVNGLLTQIFELKTYQGTNFRKKIKLNRKTFYIVKDIMKISYQEWVAYEAIMNQAETDEYILNNLHKILSIFIRPRQFNWKKLHYEIQSFDPDKLDERSEELLNLDINEAQAINLFFYHNVTNFMKNIKKHYLNNQALQLKKEINTMEAT